jgi:hypothetical protein
VTVCQAAGWAAVAGEGPLWPRVTVEDETFCDLLTAVALGAREDPSSELSAEKTPLRHCKFLIMAGSMWLSAHPTQAKGPYLTLTLAR